MSSSARTSPGRRPAPDGYGRPERGYAPPRPERPAPAPDPARRASGPSGRRASAAPVPPSAGRRTAARQASDPGGRLLAGAPSWLPAAAVLGGPMLAAIVGKFAGGYHGPAFVVLTIAAAALATAAATANGRWWVVTSLPPVAWLVATVAELAWHDPAYPDTKAKLVGVVHATTNVFPVILAALAVMGLVIAAAVVRGRQSGGGARRV
ncbi:hypothetical protein ABH926_002001 [Catenulispora sp. GP43]|uniref:hypothetical protein n=1 Tax=Catenulispora sp. GP43 TaxID=3156263 RepID=UPI003515ACB0